jgi:hypothetical protein
MKTRHFVIALIVLSLMLLATHACQAKYVARVSGLKGKVEITGISPLTGKVETKTLILYQGLEAGAKIEVAQKASLKLLFYSDTHEETINGPCKITTADKGSVLKPGAKGSIKITRKTPQFAVAPNPSEDGRSIAAAIGGQKFVSLPDAVKNLTRTRVIAALADGSPRPTFTWSAPALGPEPWYLIEVKEAGTSSSRKIIRAISKTNRFTIPASSPALVPGKKYQCIVSAWKNNPEDPKYKGKENDKSESNELKPYVFVMPSRAVLTYFKQEREKFDYLTIENPEWSSTGLSLLSLYLDYGMYDQASELAEKFRQSTPNTYFNDIIELCPKQNESMPGQVPNKP